jgi:hypothetical protein
MLKRNVSKLIISVLVIILAIVSVKYICLLEKYNRQRNTANAYLHRALGIASSDFDTISPTYKYNKDNKTNKNYNYNDAASKIASSAFIFELTTYNKNNNALLCTLYNLSDIMQNYSYKSSVIQNSRAIHSDLYKLSINPGNKQVTNNLYKLLSKLSSEE